jgi:hypothetical protein
MKTTFFRIEDLKTTPFVVRYRLCLAFKTIKTITINTPRTNWKNKSMTLNARSSSEIKTNSERSETSIMNLFFRKSET